MPYLRAGAKSEGPWRHHEANTVQDPGGTAKPLVDAKFCLQLLSALAEEHHANRLNEHEQVEE